MTKKQEVVTIEVPVRWAKYRANCNPEELSFVTGITDEATRIAVEVNGICRAALEARKTKLERWRDDARLPLTKDGGNNSVDSDGNWVFDNNLRNSRLTRLMAAAPQLLEALLRECSTYGDIHSIEVDSLESNTVEAIRAALPEDVAAEVLGDD